MPLPWQLCLLAFICGLFTRDHPVAAGLACALATLGLARGRVCLGMVACFVLGIFAPPGLDVEGAWNAEVRVRGIVDDVRTQPGRRITLVVSDVVDLDSGTTLPGRLAWTWTNPPRLPNAGQGFEARLRIRELRGRHNFGLSSSEEYWLRQEVRHRAYSRGEAAVRWDGREESLRGRLRDAVGAAVPAGQGGAVLLALLFGDRFFLDTDFMDRIRRAGLSHSLALSGLHLSLAAGLGLAAAAVACRLRPGLLLFLPRQKLALVFALPPVLGYLWLGGFTSSLLRAAIMLAALALHLARGTRSHPQDALFAAVGVLVLADPGAALDLGLQLSVLAVAGIVLFMPLLASRLEVLGGGGPLRRIAHYALSLGAVTACANLFILPIQILYFSEVPAHMWLNLLWLPVLSFWVLPLALLGLGCLAASEVLSRACFALAAQGVELLDRGLLAMDAAGWLQAMTVLRPGGIQVVGYWVVLVSGNAVLRARRPGRRAMAFLAAGLALMVAPAIWSGVASLRQTVELTVLDTGMSQAVFVRGPSGSTALVDGAGGWSAEYDPGRAIVAPALAWDRPPRVDRVVLTHMDSDHSRGLFHILETFDVGCFAWSGLLDHSPDSRRLRELLARDAWPVRRVRAGDRIDIEPGLWFDVLHPVAHESGMSGNETSIVLRLVWRGRGLALLPGDAERRALDSVLRQGGDLDAEVLVLPHHGSRSSLRNDFYERVAAMWAVAACGPANRFGFPHAEVVRACEDFGSAVLTTADFGAVRFRWRGSGPAEVGCARLDRCRGGALCPAGLSCMPPLETCNQPRSGQ
jgi:competence protein ComEC